MKKQKVLIIRLSAMGDVIFTIPLANCLKENDYEVEDPFFKQWTTLQTETSDCQ